MSDHVIKNGLDLPIVGKASGPVVDLEAPSTVAYAPTEFKGFQPRPAAREGDAVKIGSVVLTDKTDPRIVLRSPVAGRLAEIRRGARRVITDVVIENGGSDEAEPLKRWSLDELRALDRAGALEAALGSGFWPALRTRPLDRIADPNQAPQSVLIAAMESGPLMPDADVLLHADDAEALQAAAIVLGKLAPKVFLAARSGTAHPALAKLEGVERHTFSGPHPAGDPAVQVNLIDPPRGAQGRVWTIRAWDAVALGRTLLTGRFDARRVYAAVGAGVVTPRFVRTVIGAPIAHVTGPVAPGANRTLLGSVLTGTATDAARWTSFYARAVHVLPDEVPRSLLGWAMPMLGAWSFHKAFLSGLLGSRPSAGVDLRPGTFGGHRAMVPIGAYDRVIVTPDIVPEFLFKAIVAKDLEDSIQLGMLDLSLEEAALCTYVCPSKIEFDVLLREGLASYEKEA